MGSLAAQWEGQMIRLNDVKVHLQYRASFLTIQGIEVDG